MGKHRGRVVPSVSRCSHDVLVAELYPYVRALALRSPDVSRHAGAVRHCDACGRWVELQYGLADYRPGLRVRVVSASYVAQLNSGGIWASRRHVQVALRAS